ncbi:HNH endonuclease [Myxacorys almedinensis]|uniref:HNH endonuclease n=1 Tax=Myxacorys almedinensis A TaxID=2690445 RepID=A0A8J7Z2Q4_9CYAN|nr:HNH endonuclease [Myxacorys almedinensis A]
MDVDGKDLKDLFKFADYIGKKRYNRLTIRDFEDYRKFEDWRYINGKYECGTTQESRDWVRDHSDSHCPICNEYYSRRDGKTVDHKLPRSQYPWLSMEFKNLWVICSWCNKEKGEMHWYEYEHYMFLHHSDLYLTVKAARPTELLRSLRRKLP